MNLKFVLSKWNFSVCTERESVCLHNKNSFYLFIEFETMEISFFVWIQSIDLLSQIVFNCWAITVFSAIPAEKFATKKPKNTYYVDRPSVFDFIIISAKFHFIYIQYYRYQTKISKIFISIMCRRIHNNKRCQRKDERIVKTDQKRWNISWSQRRTSEQCDIMKKTNKKQTKWKKKNFLLAPQHT